MADNGTNVHRIDAGRDKSKSEVIVNVLGGIILGALVLGVAMIILAIAVRLTVAIWP